MYSPLSYLCSVLESRDLAFHPSASVGVYMKSDWGGSKLVIILLRLYQIIIIILYTLPMRTQQRVKEWA